MKFYSRYPGDIGIKTGHLTPAEFGAYDRLLDHYYATEKPIEPKRVYGIVRCQTAADRAATDAVLAEFWTLTDDGWVQDRADEVIAQARPRIEAARANGRKGGRPPGSSKKPTGFSEETQGEPRAKTLHKPESSPSSKTVSNASHSHPPGGGRSDRFDEFWQAWPKAERKQDKKACRERWHRHGLDAMADEILADVRTKRGTTKWQEGYIEAPLLYLKNRRWEDGVEPDDGNPGQGAQEWHQSVAGIRTKGVELGIGDWDQAKADVGQDVQWPVYRARVFKAAGFEPRRVA